MAGYPGNRRRTIAAAIIAAATLGAGCGDGVDFGDFPAVERSASHSTVQIDMRVDQDVSDTYDLFGESFAVGSGWISDVRTGEVVTSAHVAAAGQRARLRLRRGDDAPARVSAVDLCRDVALLYTERLPGATTMPMARAASVRRDQRVFVVGYPGGSEAQDVELRGYSGRVVRADVSEGRSFPSMLRVDAITRGGQSGGPVLDDRGRMLAMNTYGEDPPGYRNHAITAGYIEKRLRHLRRGESRGWTGWVFDTTYADPDEPVVQGRNGDRDFYGWGVVGRADGTQRVKGLTGDAGRREQYVYAIDGRRFGTRPTDLPADADEQVVCEKTGGKRAGETSVLSIVEPEYDEDTGEVTDYETFDVRVSYR